MNIVVEFRLYCEGKRILRYFYVCMLNVSFLKSKWKLFNSWYTYPILSTIFEASERKMIRVYGFKNFLLLDIVKILMIQL